MQQIWLIILIVCVVLSLAAIGVLSYFFVEASKKTNNLQNTVNAVTVTQTSPSAPSNYHNVSTLRNFVQNAPYLKILCVGDDMFSSADSLNSYSRVYSAPSFLDDILQKRAGRSLSTDSFFGYNSAIDDGRVFLSDNWVPASLPSNNFGIGGFPLYTSSATSTLTYQNSSTFRNRCQIYVIASSGNFTVYLNKATTGTVVTTSSLPQTGNIAVYTVTSPNLIVSCKIVTTGASSSKPCLIFGMIFDRADNNVIINASVDGSSSSDWIQNNYTTTLLGGGLAAINPNFVMMNLGAVDINSNNQILSIASYVQKIMTIVNYITNQGIQCLVILPAWTGTSGEQQYQTALKSALDSNTIAYYDLPTDLVSYTAQQQLGYCGQDASTVSLSPLGNVRMAQGIYNCLYSTN